MFDNFFEKMEKKYSKTAKIFRKFLLFKMGRNLSILNQNLRKITMFIQILVITFTFKVQKQFF